MLADILVNYVLRSKLLATSIPYFTQFTLYFLTNFFQAREEEELRKKDQRAAGNVKTQLPIGIQNAIRAVTTAQPTVKVSPKKLSTYYSNASSVWTEPEIQKKLPLRQTFSTKIKKEPATRRSSPKKKKTKKSEMSKYDEKPKAANKTKSSSIHRKEKKGKELSNSTVNIQLEPIIPPTEETNQIKTITNLIDGSEVVRIPRKVDESDDSDIEVDIDVETDEDASLSVDSANPEMDMVYKKLVESAGINNVANSEDSEQGISSDNNSIQYELSDGDGSDCLIKTESNETGVNKATPLEVCSMETVETEMESHSVKHDAKMCVVEPVETSVVLTHNLERYPSIGSIFESQLESSSEEDTAKHVVQCSDLEIKKETSADDFQPKKQFCNDEKSKDEATAVAEQDDYLSRDEGDTNIDDLESIDSLDGDDEDEEHING